MQVVLSVRFGILDALLQNLLRLLGELSVQIDGIGRYAPVGVILAEDEFRRLLVVLLHLATMRLSLLGQLFRACAIAALVGFARLVSVPSSQFSSIGIYECRNCRKPHKSSEINQLRMTYPLKTLTTLRGFLAREIAQPVVFRLRVAALLVVKGWK